SSLPRRRAPSSPLFPYTTLFRSLSGDGQRVRAVDHRNFPLRGVGFECQLPLQLAHFFNAEDAVVRSQKVQIRVLAAACHPARPADRKSTRLNSSHVKISYAVFCL